MPRQTIRCHSVLPIDERPLLSPIQAGGLATVFKILGNETRLRLLHALMLEPEIAMLDLARRLGLKPQAVSNQLQRLSDLGLIAARREGSHVYYRLLDRCIRELLEKAWCLMDSVPPEAASPLFRSLGDSTPGGSSSGDSPGRTSTLGPTFTTRAARGKSC